MIKYAKTCTLAFLSLSFFIMVSGCKKTEEPDATVADQNPPAQAPQQPAVAPEPVVQTTQEAGTQIDFTGRKDPFKPFVVDATRSLPQKRNKFGVVLPILNYEVSQFQLKGIIIGLKQNTAMVLDPTGKPYVVKTGMEIGRNEGKITKITSNYVEVFEKYRDENGRLNKNIIKLTLPKKE